MGGHKTLDRETYRDEIKLALTGGVLTLEIDDSTIDKVIDSAFREVQRYIDTTKLETLDYQSCIDLNPRKICAITNVFRTEGFASNSSNGISDPLYATQWQLLSTNGNIMSSDYIYNYAAWNSSLQMRNTLATDLSYLFDQAENKLYITVSTGVPAK